MKFIYYLAVYSRTLYIFSLRLLLMLEGIFGFVLHHLQCFLPYTWYNFHHDLEDNTLAKIQRINLANVVLTLKSLGIHDLVNFDFLEPPLEALLKAVEQLFSLNALNNCKDLTNTWYIADVGLNICPYMSSHAPPIQTPMFLPSQGSKSI